MKVHALTHSPNCIVDCIKTPVHLKNPYGNTQLDTLAIWDTGATNSVITRSAATDLGLIPVSKAVVNGVHGSNEVNVYYIDITLNNDQINLQIPVTECAELSTDLETRFLIGMDIIHRGDFAITNHSGKTVMTFRVPSLQPIDFVRGIKEANPFVKEKMPSRNDLCPCGSGRKFKNCCAK